MQKAQAIETVAERHGVDVKAPHRSLSLPSGHNLYHPRHAPARTR